MSSWKRRAGTSSSPRWSDWYWWYGDDFTTENAPEFDALFRRRVAQAWRALGLAPTRAARPAHHRAAQGREPTRPLVVVQPTRLIEPVIDGYTKGYYELGRRRVYRPGHQQRWLDVPRVRAPFTQLWFGFSRTPALTPPRSPQGRPTSPASCTCWSPGREQPGRIPSACASLPEAPRRESSTIAGRAAVSGRTGTLVELALSREVPGPSAGRAHLASRSGSCATRSSWIGSPATAKSKRQSPTANSSWPTGASDRPPIERNMIVGGVEWGSELPPCSTGRRRRIEGVPPPAEPLISSSDSRGWFAPEEPDRNSVPS